MVIYCSVLCSHLRQNNIEDFLIELFESFDMAPFYVSFIYLIFIEQKMNCIEFQLKKVCICFEILSV